MRIVGQRQQYVQHGADDAEPQHLVCKEEGEREVADEGRNQDRRDGDPRGEPDRAVEPDGVFLLRRRGIAVAFDRLAFSAECPIP